jgi:hypothetical protein
VKLYGEFAPGEQQDGYVPGAWDEVRRAYMDGHITAEAYELLRKALGERVTPRQAVKEESGR